MVTADKTSDETPGLRSSARSSPVEHAQPQRHPRDAQPDIEFRSRLFADLVRGIDARKREIENP
jgi:hypothetical protein